MDNDDIFYQALLSRDSQFEGTFIVGVKTTGVFCRPTCSARKPKRENVEFFASTREAVLKGYRACKVCRPMEVLDVTPGYVLKVLDALNKNPYIKLRDYEISEMGINPHQVRRWFQRHHGVSFHAYQRMYRINNAFKRYQESKSVTEIAFESGYESLSGFNEAFKKIMGASAKYSHGQQVINLMRLETPLGTMVACATNKGICLLEFSDRKMLETELKHLIKFFKAPIVQGDNQYFKALQIQLDEYFKGKLKSFDLPLDLAGTDFQQRVWHVLLQIPYGSTCSYAEQAKKLGNPLAVRAVANANGMNKISIVIPCHRVIGSDGSLTGYGGGLWRKKKLLELEQDI